MLKTYMMPQYIAVDVRAAICDFQNYAQMQYLYQRFPLKDIMSTILGVNQFVSYNEHLWFEVEKRFQGCLDQVDPAVLDLFFETLALHLDECIRARLPHYVDQSEYILDRWVDPTTIMLKRDETVQFYRDRGANECVPAPPEWDPIYPGGAWSFGRGFGL